MSNSTFTPPVTPAESKSAAKENKAMNPLSEFFYQLRVALSIHTNQVTKFNSLAVTTVILSLGYVVSVYINMVLLDSPNSRLIVPLHILTFSSYLLFGSYLFPVVHHLMKFYEKKKDKKWKAEVKRRLQAEENLPLNVEN